MRPGSHYGSLKLGAEVSEVSEARDDEALEHWALMYSDEKQWQTGVRNFVDDGLARGEPVVAVGEEKLRSALNTALGAGIVGGDGEASSPLSFVPEGRAIRGPAFAATLMSRLVQERLDGGARRVRLIAKFSTRASCGQPSNTLYEAVLSRAFSACPVTILCPYEVGPGREDSESGDTQAQVALTHPHLVDVAGSRRRSTAYVGPDDLVRRIEPCHLEMEGRAAELDIELDRNAFMPREAVRSAATAAGIEAERIDDLVIAFNEAATNAVVHGSGQIAVKLWAGPAVVLCSVKDEGKRFDDPLCGFVPPPPSRLLGRGLGLWIARQLCDEVDIVPGPDGLEVRLVVRG